MCVRAHHAAPGSETTALPFTMNGEACEHEKRYRMARHTLDDTLRRIGMSDFTYND